MPIRSMLRHSLVIERATSGTVDADGQPSRTYGPIATVMGSVQPKNVRELAQANQAGVVVGDYTVFVEPTDIAEADYILDADTWCSFVNQIFQVHGVRDAAGQRHHLEIDAVLVTPSAA